MHAKAAGGKSNLSAERARDLVEVAAGAPRADQGLLCRPGAKNEKLHEREHGEAEGFQEIAEEA